MSKIRIRIRIKREIKLKNHRNHLKFNLNRDSTTKTLTTVDQNQGAKGNHKQLDRDKKINLSHLGKPYRMFLIFRKTT